jgi:nucleotide-binding universal stress UspA family protein
VTITHAAVPNTPARYDATAIRRLLVPLDLSDESERAITPAIEVARALEVPLTLFGWHWDSGEVVAMRRYMRRRAGELDGAVDVAVACTEDRGVVAPLMDAAHEAPTLICMATHARSGMGEAVLGSIAEAVLRRGEPVLLVGPHAGSPLELSGPVLATVDGSAHSEEALPIAVEWAHALGVPVEVVTALEPSVSTRDAEPEPHDALESGYLAGLARQHGITSWEVLHGHDPGSAISRYATGNASLIVAATHGRTGLARVVVGSVAMRIVHDAPCPVLLFRPADLD